VRVLFRSGNYGGTGLTTSFSLAMGEGTPLDGSIDTLLAHEHFHSWCGQTIEPDPPEQDAYWFTEGFTTFYTSRLLYRAGMLNLADYAASLDRDLVAYTASSARELPNANIGAGFWTLRGVVPGSAAERAGLKNGDHLDAIDAQIGEPDRPVRLGINGRTVTYQPARELDVLAFDVHDANACTSVLGGPLRASAR
jgi:predicted metalloprotease with PDZ domain